MKLNKGNNDIGKKLQQFYTELDEIVASYDKDLAIKLAKRGWFLTRIETIGFHRAALDLIKEEKESDVDLLFKITLEEELQTTCSRLKSRHPQLKGLLEQGYKCHGQGFFFSSIPIFLILAESICNMRVTRILDLDKPVTNILFNSDRDAERKGFAKGTSGIATNVTGSFEDVEMKYNFYTHFPLLGKHFFNLSSTENPHSRHSIFHGLSYDYGTELNSLRAVCFLNYIDDTLLELEHKLNRNA